MFDERTTLIYLLNLCFVNPLDVPRVGEEEENVEMMKRVIQANPQLSEPERNLLSCLYKSIINRRREVLRDFDKKFVDEIVDYPNRVQRLDEFREKLVSEIDEHCEDLCKLIETELLPVANNPETRVFYEKMEADYYRYMAENHTGDEKAAIIEKAGSHYKTALAISNSELSQASTTALGLTLNYSVFLYEMMDRHQEAIDLAAKSVQETIDLLDTLSDKTYNEATKIIYLLKDNVKNWKERLNL